MNNQYPLKGLRILNTRPYPQGKLLSQAIVEKGGLSIHLPLLSIEATQTNWLEKLPPLNQFKQAIFVSPNAVHYFFDGLKLSHNHWPTSLCISTLGAASAKALKQLGLIAKASPAISDSEHLLAMPQFQDVHAQAILIVKGEDGRPLLAQSLKQRGAIIHELSVYKRHNCPIDLNQLTSLWQEDALDIIIFTSLEAMQHFHKQSAHLAAWFCQKPCIVLSERLAHAARNIGYMKVMLAAPHAILATLEQFAQGRSDDRHTAHKNH